MYRVAIRCAERRSIVEAVLHLHPGRDPIVLADDAAVAAADVTAIDHTLSSADGCATLLPEQCAHHHTQRTPDGATITAAGVAADHTANDLSHDAAAVDADYQPIAAPNLCADGGPIGRAGQLSDGRSDVSAVDPPNIYTQLSSHGSSH